MRTQKSPLTMVFSLVSTHAGGIVILSCVAAGDYVGVMMINLHAAWIGFLLGCVAGAVPGLFFHNPDWLGGYTSWPRRMIRLAHIAFFGLGFLNLSFALTAQSLHLDSGLQTVSVLFLVGAIAMPAVCYLSAWKLAFQRLFFIPALSIIVGIALFTWRIIRL